MKEQKIIRYRLSISRYFPANHPNKGKETNFIDQIERGSKIHTIRANAALWAKRMQKIQEGKAVIELYYWSDKPYHSHPVVFKVIDKDSGCGIQYVRMNSIKETGSAVIVTPGGLGLVSSVDLCLNDGLRLLHFIDWFKKYDLSKTLAIIHFTEYRYPLIQKP